MQECNINKDRPVPAASHTQLCILSPPSRSSCKVLRLGSAEVIRFLGSSPFPPQGPPHTSWSTPIPALELGYQSLLGTLPVVMAHGGQEMDCLVELSLAWMLGVARVTSGVGPHRGSGTHGIALTQTYHCWAHCSTG